MGKVGGPTGLDAGSGKGKSAPPISCPQPGSQAAILPSEGTTRANAGHSVRDWGVRRESKENKRKTEQRVRRGWPGVHTTCLVSWCAASEAAAPAMGWSPTGYTGLAPLPLWIPRASTVLNKDLVTELLTAASPLTQWSFGRHTTCGQTQPSGRQRGSFPSTAATGGGRGGRA